MRPLALFSALCALIALILSLLVLFAGSTHNFLQNAQIMTLNTSRIGHTTLFQNSSSGGFFSSLENDIKGELSNLVGEAGSDIAKALNLHDFYNVHILTYCEGFYSPNATAHDAHKNITSCSNRTALWNFDPGAVIQQELPSNVTLEDLHWPQEIENESKHLRVAFRAMVVFYCIGIAAAGLSFITAVLGFLAGGRISAFFNFLIAGMAALALGIASAIGTAVVVETVDKFNKYGKLIGVSGYKGRAYLGMTWAAFLVMGLGSIIWIFECIVGRRHRGEKTRY